MAAKPQATNGTLRRLVREVLAMAPGYKFPEPALMGSVRELLPVNAAADSDILAAAEWNLGHGYIENSMNDETDTREWQITHHGLAQQNLK